MEVVEMTVMQNSRRLRLVLLVLLLTAILVGVIVLRQQIQENLETVLDWMQQLGPWGPVILALAYVPACVLFIPGTLLTLAAGFLFGVLWGTIAVSAGSVTGA